MCADVSESECASRGFIKTARVHIISAKGKEKPVGVAKLIFAHRIYWKRIADCKEDDSNTLLDFKKSSSLEISRLEPSAVWGNVIGKVKPDDRDGPGVTVFGKLHGRARRSMDTALNGFVDVLLVASNPEERDEWMRELRFRIAPPALLYRRAKHIVLSDPEADNLSLVEFSRKMNDLIAAGAKVKLTTQLSSSDTRAGRAGASVKLGLKNIQKFEWLDKLVAQASLLTGSLAKGIGRVAEKVGDCDLEGRTANVAEIAKIFPGGASSIFQLALVTFKIVVMISESYRGRRELPNIFIQVGELLDCVVRCIAPILHPAGASETSEEILERYPFKVLVKAIDLLGKIEEHLMKNGLTQFLNASEVEGFESELEDLESMVAHVAVTKEVKEVKHQIGHYRTLRVLSTRPDPSHYFVGREEKIEELSHKLNQHSSAVITGFGGIGKTQLMSEFAERVENNRTHPRTVFWIQSCETAADIVDSLACLAETLLSGRFLDQDRADKDKVIPALHQRLNETGKAWLLCLDNVDNTLDSETRRVLNKVTTMAKGTKGKEGWVLITSRSAQPKLWTTMKSIQRVMLSPFKHDIALCLFWRVVHSITCEEKNDVELNEDITQWKHENPTEYQSLQELLKLLSGLPLAIVQAGSYIGSCDECTFSSYLQLYEKTEIVFGEEDVDMVALIDDQRSVLTTWNINVKRLSEESRHVYLVIAMLDDSCIPRKLIDAILEDVPCGTKSLEVKVADLVLKPLIQMSSLIDKNGTGADATFHMHRVIRKITLMNLKKNVQLEGWREVSHSALRSVYSIAALALKERKSSFIDSPEVFRSEYRLCVPHALCLTQRFVSDSHGLSFLVPQITELYRFCGGAHMFLGFYSDSVRMFEKLLKLLRNHYGANVNNEAIAFALRELGEAYVMTDELEKAEKTLHECITMYNSFLEEGEVRLAVANTLGNLGNTYMKLHKLDDAKLMYEKCLEMKRAIYTENHSEIANVIGNLSQVYLRQKNLNMALKLQQKCLRIRHTVDDSSNGPGIARTLGALSGIFLEMNQLDNAESTILECLRLRREVHKNNTEHIEIAKTLLNLCRIYLARGKLAEALSSVEEGLRILYKVFGSEAVHSEAARALEYYGVIYSQQGKYDEAVSKLEKSLSICLDIEKEKGACSSILPLRKRLFRIYVERGMLDQAEVHIDALLNISNA